MNSAGDGPLTRGEETALVLACFLFTPLVAVTAYFWWRDSFPQRADSVLALARQLFTILLIVVAAGAALLFLSQLLRS